MIGPSKECPASTYGPGSPDAVNTASRSAAAAFAEVGCGTAVERLGPVAVEVDGRSYAQTRVNVATSAKTVDRSFSGSDVTLQISAPSPRPETSTTVGPPLPRHSMYIWRPPSMSTRPAKSASLSAIAVSCVASLDSDDAEVSELLPLHPAATSAKATMVMRIKRTESPAFLAPQSPIKRYCGHYTQRCSLALAYGPTPR